MISKIFRFIGAYLVVSFVFLLVIFYFAVDIVTYPKSEKKQCDIAVIEGWLYDEHIEYFHNQLKDYNKIYTIGGKFERAIEYFPYDNLAELMKDRLDRYGLVKEKIVPIVTDNKKDRTYSSMAGLKEYVKEPECIDLYTHQRHSYRSYLNISNLFQLADINLFYKNSIKLENGEWLKQSNEFKEVIMELISIGYTKIKLIGE